MKISKNSAITIVSFCIAVLIMLLTFILVKEHYEQEMQVKIYSTPPYQWDHVEYTIWSDSAIGTQLKITYNDSYRR